MRIQHLGSLVQPTAMRFAGTARQKKLPSQFGLEKVDVRRFEQAQDAEAAYAVIEDLVQKAPQNYLIGERLQAQKLVLRVLINASIYQTPHEQMQRQLGWINGYVINKMPDDIWRLIILKDNEP